MSEVKKIATRDSYGNALVERRAAQTTWWFWTRTWQVLPKPGFLRRPTPTAISTAALPSAI